MYEPIERLQAQAQAYVLEQTENGVPLVGYVYGFAPPELPRACGAAPVRLRVSGGYEAQHAGQQLTQGNTCTYCKAIVGGAQSAPLDRLALLVSDGLCEALRRAGEVWDVRFGRAHPVRAARGQRFGAGTLRRGAWRAAGGGVRVDRPRLR